MARQARPVVPEVPLHITQRGNNRLECFFGDTDFLVYLDLLRTAAEQARCRVHAYVLMTNHVHLLVSPSDERGPASLMKSLGERYVQYVNRRYERTGTLWEGRYRSCLVQSERYLMVCHRYIEMNPVRAQLVSHPDAYRWSSFRRNAHGEQSALISPHSLYSCLGNDSTSREHAYRAMFSEALSDSELIEVRHATHRHMALGSEEFKDKMTRIVGRPLTQRRTRKQ